jgi:hypothetical protein
VAIAPCSSTDPSAGGLPHGLLTVSGLGDVPAECFEGHAVRFRSAAHSGVERVDRGELLGGELEFDDVEVLGDAGGLGRLRDGRAASCWCQLSMT